jgi:hypothetical protein
MARFPGERVMVAALQRPLPARLSGCEECLEFAMRDSLGHGQRSANGGLPLS